MKYQVGSIGKVVVARFEDGDDVLHGLSDIAVKEEIKSAVFYLVGGLKEAKIVVGPEEDRLPPVPVWRNIVESHESVGIGTIFYYGSEPKVHFHGAYGKRDSVRMGCLRETARTFLVMEAIVLEIRGVNAVRDLDPESGMVLLKLLDIPTDEGWKFPDLQIP
jgi:predicted DNA-binding protein with PD1-like motif